MSFSSSSLTIIGKIKRSVGLLDGSRANFPSIFDAWNEDPKNPAHNYMADYYRNAIIAGLKEYASSIIDLTGFKNLRVLARPVFGTNFDALYEMYRQKKNASHKLMSDKYINVMSKALKEVHPLLGDKAFIDNYNTNTLWHWDDFYKELAWIGLLGTPKGKEHKQEDDYATNVSLYRDSAKAQSTKTPKCDE